MSLSEKNQPDRKSQKLLLDELASARQEAKGPGGGKNQRLRAAALPDGRRGHPSGDG